MSELTTKQPQMDVPSPDRALSNAAPRIWPLIVLGCFQLAVLTIPGRIAPSTLFHFMSMMWGTLASLILTAVWLIAFSRLRMRERLLAIGLVLMLMLIAIFSADPTLNAMVLGLVIWPWTLVACAAVALVSLPFGWPVQRFALALSLIIATGLTLCLRLDGVRGTITAEFSPRWNPTNEAELLAELEQSRAAHLAPDQEALSAQTSTWPGFRGPQRDSILRGATFALDWDKHPPQELWRRKIGPGWGSFCIIGKQLVTQEQRGDQELVTCYDATNGEQIWQSAIKTRFEEALAGPGPRATPTFHSGKLYALGGSGFLSCIDAVNGEIIWQHDLTKDVDAKTPEWGFASSPLVFAQTVIVFAGDQSYTGQSDQAGKAVVAYDLITGEIQWTSGRGKHSYSSPQLAKLAGVDQLVMVTDWGVQGLAPSDGQVLWENEWDIQPGNRVVQPQIIADSVYVGTGLGMGTRKLDIQHNADQWSATEAWTSRNLKPYFNDFVQHDGHFYGFDDRIFTCIEAATGERLWKGGRYGHGQTLLVEDAGVLIIVSEDGELALVKATPDGHEEITKFRIFAGKTWNHPVVDDGKLFVRNGEEMVCFQLRDWQVKKAADE